MKIDITSLRLETTNSEHVRIAMKKANHSEYSEHETFFVISKKEWQLFIRSCVLGCAPVYPYSNDCTYLLLFHPNGMRVAYTDRREMDYFTLPMNKLVGPIDELFSRDDGERHEIILTEFIPEWQYEYRPNVVIRAELDVLEQLEKDEVSPFLSEKVSVGLIERLTRWAENYSDGNEITVNICFDSRRKDGRPSHYYWWIANTDGSRIVNGGWIAHSDQWPEAETSTYNYSMHT